MKIITNYDEFSDLLTVYFENSKAASCEPLNKYPNILLEYDEHKSVVGLQMLGLGAFIKNWNRHNIDFWNNEVPVNIINGVTAFLAEKYKLIYQESYRDGIPALLLTPLDRK